ncbi:819_t:CDS:10 [Diversispora eburnea]|uniref:Chromatin modification-related protein EAF3 n=1 Tax=Diversispora eburnea TaxID=1213867 RepID=A0A9N8ZN95_9GLOM|nr:819_t:CDS:10 [Diversispora eburnea]
MTQTGNKDTKLNFSENEVVLCFHGPLLYEAKILKAENWGSNDSGSGDKGPHYFVHYKGWKKTWDEWVPEERVVKHNEANLARQKQLKETFSNKKKKPALNKERSITEIDEISSTNKRQKIGTTQEMKKNVQSKRTISAQDHQNDTQDRQQSSNDEIQEGGASAEQNEEHQFEDSIKHDEEMKDDKEELKGIDENNNDNVNDGQSQQRSKKRSRMEEEEEEEDEYMNRLEIKISIPESLKCRLIDDWENVTKSHSLLKLPRTPNVIDILNHYVEYKRKILGDIYTEVANGLQIYFEKTLGNILLYSTERQQYVDIRKQYIEKENAEIYGAEHLLRLFVELPRLLAHSHLDKTATETLEEHLEDFLKFLQKKEEQYFVNEYDRNGMPPARKQKTSNEKKPCGYNNANNNSEGWVCGNCGTSNTPGWRAGETPDQKLCNACGLYYAKYKSHRPSSLWNSQRGKAS